MMDRSPYKGMNELEEAANGVLAIPCPPEEREKDRAETSRVIELMKQGKFAPVEAMPHGQKPE